MDSNVNGVRSGGVFGIQPTSKRKDREKEQQKPFSLEKSDNPAPPVGKETTSEILPCSEREDNESGGTLDLTA